MNDRKTSYDAMNEIVALRRKHQVLQIAVVGIFFIWLVTAWLLFIRPVAAVTERPPISPITKADRLQIRELVVVDKNGTPRVRIAAPQPDPIMLGKRFDRMGDVSGIIIYDAEGNERGGYGTSDDVDRTAFLTLDEINRAAVHLGVSDRGEHTFLSATERVAILEWG